MQILGISTHKHLSVYQKLVQKEKYLTQPSDVNLVHLCANNA